MEYCIVNIMKKKYGKSTFVLIMSSDMMPPHQIERSHQSKNIVWMTYESVKADCLWERSSSLQGRYAPPGLGQTRTKTELNGFWGTTLPNPTCVLEENHRIGGNDLPEAAWGREGTDRTGNLNKRLLLLTVLAAVHQLQHFCHISQTSCSRECVNSENSQKWGAQSRSAQCFRRQLLKMGGEKAGRNMQELAENAWLGTNLDKARSVFLRCRQPKGGIQICLWNPVLWTWIKREEILRDLLLLEDAAG